MQDPNQPGYSGNYHNPRFPHTPNHSENNTSSKADKTIDSFLGLVFLFGIIGLIIYHASWVWRIVIIGSLISWFSIPKSRIFIIIGGLICFVISRQ